MSKFRYRMQNILDIKLKLEEQAKMQLASANARLREEQDKLALLYRRKAAYEEDARRLRNDTLRVRDILDNETAIEKMQEAVRKQILEVKAAERTVEHARARLQGVMQERKTHEKLKEHAFEDFKREENARETKEIDELTSYTHGRKTANKTE